MNKNVLIFGKNSFVASGIEEPLNKAGYPVDFFTRGNEGRVDTTVFGKTKDILTNSFFKERYRYVVNYVVLKDAGVEENIEFIKLLLEFCKKYGVEKFIHFSSIMVYDYANTRVDEYTPIEPLAKTLKKGYGEIKIAVDEYLWSVKDSLPFELILVRPGFVLSESVPCPFVKKMPLHFTAIKGNKKSRQPIVKREDIHLAIRNIIEKPTTMNVYHLFPNDGMTKYKYAKQAVGGVIITLPKWIFKDIPYLLSNIGVIPKSLYSRFEGMFIETDFQSQKTEAELQMKFA